MQLQAAGRLRPRVFGKELENVLVFLMGLRLAKGLDVIEEVLHGLGKRQLIVLFLGCGDLEPALAGFQFQALAFLGLRWPRMELCRPRRAYASRSRATR